MSFALNYMDLFEIDITPNAASETWARLGSGLSSADPSNNENIDQTAYLDDDGYGTSTVIGAQKIISFSGHRELGDSAQDYIASIQNTLGSSRNTTFRYTDADGSKMSGPCIIANIDIGGGDAGAKKEISFEVHMNGKPTDTPKSAAETLTSTVAAGSVAGTTKFTATAGAGNTLAYKLLPQTAGTVYGSAYIDGYTNYTSAANITASVGQYLQMFEIDANKRIVKFAEKLLDAGDFPS